MIRKLAREAKAKKESGQQRGEDIYVRADILF